jgi:murein hydrolase activator
MIRVFFIALLFSASIFVLGQDRAALEKMKLEAIQELEMAKELLDKTRNQRTNTIKHVSLINKGIESREEIIKSVSREIEWMDKEIIELESEIGRLDQKISQGREEYARIIYSIYKNHTEEEKFMYLFASENLNQFYQRIKYMKYLKEYREEMVQELEGMMEELENKTKEIIQIRNEKSSLLKEKEAENRKLIGERNERNSLVRKLSQDEQKIRRQIQENERISRELEDRIKKMIEEEARKRSANSLLSSLTPEQKLLGDSFLSNKGRLPWPVERGVITSKFGIVNHPILSGVKISNNGVDISAISGTKGRAIYDGEVTSIFAILGANYAVIVMHGEYLSVYQNLVELKVKVGDKVKSKQELGTIHSDTNENMAVLHLQIWRSKEILNPDEWLSK